MRFILPHFTPTIMPLLNASLYIILFRFLPVLFFDSYDRVHLMVSPERLAKGGGVRLAKGGGVRLAKGGAPSKGRGGARLAKGGAPSKGRGGAAHKAEGGCVLFVRKVFCQGKCPQGFYFSPPFFIVEAGIIFRF